MVQATRVITKRGKWLEYLNNLGLGNGFRGVYY